MVFFPNAKINFGLRVVNRLDNGYHEIESCFYPVEWKDILEVIPADQPSFKSYGLTIPGNSEDNLCLKAVNLLRKDMEFPEVAIRLWKNIPMGAGLGGGSADGAFTLKALNQVFDLNLSQQQLESYAEQLGSDCTFFIRNTPSYVQGVGNILQDIDPILKGKWIMLINPQTHISTKEAYARISVKKPETSFTTLIEDSSRWKDELVNDFEIAVKDLVPDFQMLKSALKELGAFYISMTGSGSTMYGLFDSEPILPSLPDHCMIHKSRLN